MTPNEPRDTEPESPRGVSPRVRRRVEQSPGAGEFRGRSGCLIAGAVLGVIVGATFAFYGLPPILRHFYGERHVAAGQEYDGDAKTVRVAYFARQPDPAVQGSAAASDAYYLSLDVLTNKTWNPSLTDFSVQFEGVDRWVPADAARGIEVSNGVMRFPLTVQTRVELRFPRPIDAGARPRYLHVADPLIRFELPSEPQR